MFVSKEAIKEMEERFGEPRRADFLIPVMTEEFERIRSSQKNGRRHDITLYIVKDGKIVVIAKPFYPPGMYRAPSGGLNPGEDFIAGALREAWEETGCEIELERFLLTTSVEFVKLPERKEKIEWNSYVFQARYVSGDFEFTDKREIREVRMAALTEFEKFSAIMRDLPVGGLHYRAALHDAVKDLLVLE